MHNNTFLFTRLILAFMGPFCLPTGSAYPQYQDSIALLPDNSLLVLMRDSSNHRFCHYSETGQYFDYNGIGWIFGEICVLRASGDTHMSHSITQTPTSPEHLPSRSISIRQTPTKTISTSAQCNAPLISFLPCNWIMEMRGCGMW